MDSRKVLEKLLKIAENQQKIITKLAQALPPDTLPTGGANVTPSKVPGPAAPPPAQHLEPKKVEHQDLQTMVLGANPKLGGTVATVAYGGPGQINVSFKPGQATQANYDAVLSTIQGLETSQKIQPAGHKVHVA